ncbi:hypothetical protein N658DRAFT_505931 [Parathielavia hyrcaniae]|uniref:Uncharacterized protein n=1 Tax=Parathielavia hyrcaniae TaxID=113614 RepID=A0AAN6T2Z8_9PEZI|nr:hypothetical protein N658DRAFT_505931 [Parathielavia hyrcaniae]
MSSHKHRSDPNRRRSKTVHSLASDGSTVNSAAPSYPSTPGGGTSSTGLTSPSDTPTDFDQTQLPNQQHPALLGAEAFGSYYQAPFGDPQMYPSQDGYAQLGQDHAQYWQSTVAQGTHVPPGQDQETHGSSSGQDVYAQLDQYHEYYGQSSSGQDVYSSPGQDQGYQAQGSAETEAEAEAYASPGSSDDMATSMVVSPGSPPSPSK